jgi:hypothetical protein
MADRHSAEFDLYRRLALALALAFLLALIVAIAVVGGVNAAVVALAIGTVVAGGFGVWLTGQDNALRRAEIQASRGGRPVSTGSWADQRPPGPRPAVAVPPATPTNRITPPTERSSDA